MHNKDKFDEKRLATIPAEKPFLINIADKLKTLKQENNSENEDKKIKISFQVFDRTNELFNLGETESEWFLEMIDVLKSLSNITKKQLFNECKKEFRPHPYKDQENLNCQDSMLCDPQCESIEIKIAKSKGRIHGFFIENIYYIRFLDRWHNMYNDKIYGGIIKKEPSSSLYEILEEKYKKLDVENTILKNKINNNYDVFCDNCKDCLNLDTILKKIV